MSFGRQLLKFHKFMLDEFGWKCVDPVGKEMEFECKYSRVHVGMLESCGVVLQITLESHWLLRVGMETPVALQPRVSL